MKKELIAILLTAICTTGCVSWKNMPNSPSLYSQAINIAIRDLDVKYPASRKHSVLSTRVRTHKTFYEPIDSNILVVSFIEPLIKLFPDSTDAIGGSGGYMPTRHTIYKNRLFYWPDPEYKINESTIEALNKFNVIDSINIKDPTANHIETATKENAFLVYYYFCKDNLSNYKSARSGGWRYETKVPRLDCSKQKRVRTK